MKRLIYILLTIFTTILYCSETVGMPRRIQFSAGHTTEYLYDADGRKLRTVHRTAVPNMSVPLNSTAELDATNTLGKDSTDYVGSFILRQGQLDKYLFDGGYVTFSGATPQFHYYGRDHLGNNRTVVNSNGTLEQVTHYYPFGGIMGDITYNASTQEYKYNGKEFDHTHGLDWYDYGARNYDAVLGQWNGVDRLAEKYPYLSPYHFGKDNPLRYKDLDGNDNFDVVAGWTIGLVTNTIPGTSGLRDEYTPNDAADYNNALQGADNAAMTIGGMANDAGDGMMAGGTVIATAGVTSVVATGGAAALGGVTAVGDGKTTTVGGALLKALGVMMQMNAANNKSEGYEKGKNSTGKNDRHYNQKRKEVHKNRLNDLRNQRKELRNKKRTPEVRKELEKLDKQIEHEQRKSEEKGETHHRK